MAGPKVRRDVCDAVARSFTVQFEPGVDVRPRPKLGLPDNLGLPDSQSAFAFKAIIPIYATLSCGPAC